MAETLVELVAKIKADSSNLEKGLADAEHKTEASSKNMADSLKKVGLAMAASGAAITATLGMMGKAAIDEEINIKHLQIALKGVGVSYDDVKDSLESVITATQKKTGIADSEQRDTLSRLILVTKDYDKALKLLPLTLDLATFNQMDTASAATYLGKAFEELENGAEKISIRMGTTSVEFKNLDEVQKMVGGTAEAMVNPFNVLKASMGDVAETIGAFLIPIIKDSIKVIVNTIEKLQEWAKTNPELAKTLTLLTLGTGGIMSLIGGIILLLPQLTKVAETLRIVATAAGISRTAILGFYASLLLIPAIIAAVIIGLEYLDKKFDLPGVKGGSKSIDEQVKAYGKLGNSIDATATRVKGYSESVTIFSERDIEAYRKLGYEITIVGETAKKEAIKQEKATEDIKSSLQKLRDTYGDLGNAMKTKADQARSASDQANRALDLELDKARKSYNTQMGYLSNLYSEKIRLINAGATEAIKKIQDQIDAIDKQTETEDRALQDQQAKDRKAELTKRVEDAKTSEEYARAKKELTDFVADVERRHLLQKRDDDKDALRESIDNIRTNTQTQVDALNEELKAKQQNEQNILTAVENRVNQSKTLLDEALTKELDNLAKELKSKEDIELAKLDITESTLAKEEQANRDSYTQQLKDAQEYISRRAAIFSQVAGIGTVITGTGMSISDFAAQYGMSESAARDTVNRYRENPNSPEFADTKGVLENVIGYKEGGLVPSTGLAYLHAGETVIPANESIGGVIINFTQPVFFDREDTMNRFVDMIRKGIQRQDRLRFGGAYNG